MLNRSYIRWQVIAALLLVPLLMGVLSLFGLTQGIEPYLWLGFSALAGFILSRHEQQRLLIHAMIIGVLWGIANGAIQTTFFSQYLYSNPEMADEFRSVTFMNPRALPVLGGVIPGLMTGMIIFGVAWAWLRLKRHRRLTDSESRSSE